MLSLLDALLASTARLLVARGVPFPEFAERMKAHYLAAAQSLADGEKATDSRLSVMTGLQRRDVSRLKDAELKETRAHHLSRLIALWQNDPALKGKPLARNGPAPSFEILAQTVNKDVHPRTMLDTLEASGTVEVSGDKIHLLKSSYQPLAGSEDQISYLSKNTGDHLAAATENVLGQAPPHFERAVHYTRLTEGQVEELHREFSALEMEIYKKISQKAAEMKRNETGTHRFRAGSYFYHSKETK